MLEEHVGAAGPAAGGGRLRGQRTLVLGGSSGIGLAAARAAARASSQVVLLARSAEKLARALASLPGAEHRTLAVDAASPRALSGLAEATGDVDHLVLSIGAAGAAPAPFAESSLPEARASFEHHYWSAVNVLHAALPALRASPRSSITFVTGGISRRPLRGKAFTTSYQCALEGLARALVDELAPIRVNTVAPGLVDTPLWDDMPAGVKTAMFEAACAENPVGFVPDAEPVGQAIVELMSNRYVSGATLSVDGGWTVSRRAATR